MRIVTDLSEYAMLDRVERLSAYLVEDVVAAVPVDLVDDPLIDLRALPGADVLVFADSLPNSLMRSAAAERLVAIGRSLVEKGFALEVVECFRPYERQKKEFNEISFRMKNEHPNLAGIDLWRKITEFIADPDLCPPHLTGGAVDVRLLDHSGSAIDMGTPINAIDPTAALMHPGIGDDAVRNRRALLDAFLRHEFAPMPSEWWHFSYGDRYWGAFYDRASIYDIVHS